MSSKAEEPSPTNLAALAQPVMVFRLLDRVSHLEQLPAYVEGKPSGETLVKGEDLRIVLIALRQNGRMQKHHASGPISLHVLTGSVVVTLPGRSESLESGALLALEAGVPHDVEAAVDSVILLTLGSTKYTVPEGNVHSIK